MMHDDEETVSSVDSLPHHHHYNNRHLIFTNFWYRVVPRNDNLLRSVSGSVLTGGGNEYKI